MRLHRLEIRAFGPFADTEEVDFDAVTRSGLFLLHGPTGSGKTSVLDAVCFALYGAVPGARAGAGRLRSDHAAPDLAPKVTCEFSIGPRRFEVVRSPAWERPKRRGEGMTTEPAKVTVREWADGSWLTRTTRPDESGHLLTGVLGMGHDQFTKLVLLPQGEFAAFLRADAETRRVMLEKLFDTDRFSAVQQWLRDTTGLLRHRVDEDLAVTRELLARADQAVLALPGDVPDPPGASGPPDPPDDEPSPRDRLAGHLALALRAREEATSRRTATSAGLARARQARTAGVDLARRQADHARLTASARRLDAGATVQEENRLRVRNAERALGVAPVAPEVHDAEQALDTARAGLDHAVTSLDHAAQDDAALASASEALRERTGLLRGIAVEAERLPQVEAHRCGLADEVDRERRALAGAVAAAASFGPALAATLERL
ncbi:MAG: repair protein SbcC/Rad50, partial [Actinomycetota bacterium]|nr:repair protein SbcC/Rad50 [Actinomycetota bacterium]